jgi:hypothetical protein
MPALCTLCALPDVASLDADLSAGVPYRTIESRYGVSHGALSRHKHHLDQAASAVVHNAPEVVHTPQPVVHDPASLVTELLAPVLTDPIAALFTYTDEGAYLADVTAKTTAVSAAEATVREAWDILRSAATALGPFLVLEHTGVEQLRGLPTGLRFKTDIPELARPRLERNQAEQTVHAATLTWYDHIEALDKARKQLTAADMTWQRDQARRRYLATPDGQEWQRDYERISRQLQLADREHDKELIHLRIRQKHELSERLAMAVSRQQRPVTSPPPAPRERPDPGQEPALVGMVLFDGRGGWTR